MNIFDQELYDYSRRFTMTDEDMPDLAVAVTRAGKTKNASTLALTVTVCVVALGLFAIGAFFVGPSSERTPSSASVGGSLRRGVSSTAVHSLVSHRWKLARIIIQGISTDIKDDSKLVFAGGGVGDTRGNGAAVKVAPGVLRFITTWANDASSVRVYSDKGITLDQQNVLVAVLSGTVSWVIHNSNSLVINHPNVGSVQYRRVGA